MNDAILTVILVSIAAVVLLALCWLARKDRDALLGKRLIDAAGSLEMAELAVRQAREIRLMNDADTDALMRRGMRALSNNVVHLQFKNRGQPVHFEPPGAA